jgi:hypothetical protein
MRDDMFEVIIERPRWGSRMKHRRRARRIDAKAASANDPDSLPAQIGMRRWALFGTPKSLNENLAPLRRYLEAQADRPWNKVWSEITANLSAASTVQQHVRDHVLDFVAVSTFVKDGTVWLNPRRGRLGPLAESHYRLYVDPRTGLLRRNKHYRSWQRRRREDDAAATRERAARMRSVSADTQLHLLDDGAWWEVTLAPLPTVRQRRANPMTGTLREYDAVDESAYVDVVLRTGLSRLPPHELYGLYGVFAVDKRQLSRREAVRLGLPVGS